MSAGNAGMTLARGTKGRFAVNALIDLALREAAGPVALATISARQQVSLSYLEQLFSRLRREGIVQSTRGPGGGYALGRPSPQITVADIVTGVDESREGTDGEGTDNGLSQSLGLRLNATMLQHMATITLETSGRRAEGPGRRGGDQTRAPRHCSAACGADASHDGAEFGLRLRTLIRSLSMTAAPPVLMSS